MRSDDAAAAAATRSSLPSPFSFSFFGGGGAASAEGNDGGGGGGTKKRRTSSSSKASGTSLSRPRVTMSRMSSSSQHGSIATGVYVGGDGSGSFSASTPAAAGSAAAAAAFDSGGSQLRQRAIDSIRLDFSRRGDEARLFGRDAELERLDEAYQQLLLSKQRQQRVRRRGQKQREQDLPPLAVGSEERDEGVGGRGAPVVAMVYGYSGTGKTALVLKGLAEPVKRDGGYFCSGKFEVGGSFRPYSAIVDAFTDLCEQLAGSGSSRGDDPPGWHYRMLRDALGDDDYDMLSTVIPAFAGLAGKRDANDDHIYSKKLTGQQSKPQTESPTNSNTNMKREWGFERLKQILRKLLEALCARDGPVVLFLDDLQWSDVGCLNLFYSLATESDAAGLCLCGAYRDNEVADHHPLRTVVLDRLDEQKHEQLGGTGDRSVSVIDIHVNDLNLPAIHRLVSDVLGLPQEETRALAEACIVKTQGNVFFVIQFLKTLQDDGLLYFSSKAYKWSWDIDAILHETSISDNVVEVVSGRMNRLPVEERSILSLGSCIGRRLDVDVLAYILGHELGKFGTFPAPPSRYVKSVWCYYPGLQQLHHSIVMIEHSFFLPVRLTLSSCLNHLGSLKGRSGMFAGEVGRRGPPEPVRSL